MDIGRFYLVDKLEFQRAPYYQLPSFENKSNEKLVKFRNDTKSLHLSSDKSDESSRCSFSALSDEIILKILENLDWRSLCRVSRVNKCLNRVAQDPHLYTNLNICYSDLNHNFINSHFSERSLLHYFTPRCKYLRLLSLTEFHIEWSDLEKFLISCGRDLTHLRLESCNGINDVTLSHIVEICQDLKELALGECTLTDEGLLCLENLQFLESLYIAEIHINSETVCKILRRNRRIRHLGIFIYDMNADDIAVELRNSCPDLESITLFNETTLTPQGIDTLADCKNLRKVDFQLCGSLSDFGDSFHKLFSSCQRLEEINLEYFSGLITEYNFEALTLCKNLKYLNLHYMTHCPTTATCLKILLNCPKLEKIFLSCHVRDLNDTRNLFNQWIEKYSLHSVHVDLQPIGSS